MALRITTALALAAVSFAQTENWDRYRGPNGTGLASGEYPVKIAPGENVAWERAFPAGMSSPTVNETRLYLTGLEDEKLTTYALDRATGETIWKQHVPRERRTKFHAKNHAAAASVAIDAETVVAFFDEFGLVAYDHDGKELWNLPMGPFDNIYGMGASPVLVDGVCVLPCDQQTKSFVIAVDAKTGEERWRKDRPQAISGHCSPVVLRAGETPLVLIPGSFLLDAYNLKTGEVAWSLAGLPAEMKSVPVLIGNTLYTHGYASPLNDQGNQVELPPFAEADSNEDGAIDPNEIPDKGVARYFEWLDSSKNGSLDPEEWKVTCAMFAAVNSAMAVEVGPKSAKVLWHQYRNIPQLPSPLVIGDTYFMLSDSGGMLTTLDAGTGERRERTRLVDAVDNYYTAPVAGGGHVYLLSESGILTVLKSSGELEPVHTAEFDARCYATPTLADGRIYLRTMETLYCFSAESR